MSGRDAAPVVLGVNGLAHGHGTGHRRVEVLHGVTFDVRRGEVVVLRGPSGSGKTTVCHLAAGVGVPDRGTVEVGRRPADQVADWSTVALVPQQHGLLAGLSVADNIALPVHRRGGDPAVRVAALADDLDLAAIVHRDVTQSSLGEQQRAAVARALVLEPQLVVLDEPTGHQDDDHLDLVLTTLRSAADRGCALLVASHEPRVWEIADRVLTLHGGLVTGRVSDR